MGSTRRKFLSAAGAASIGAALGVPADAALDAEHAPAEVPFHGTHQAGIATPTQKYMQFLALDLVNDSVDDLAAMLRRLTTAAALLARGKPVGSMRTGDAPPVDTGESAGLGAARTTITFGFGPGVFADNRFGLERHRPAPLVDLPHFDGDAIEPSISGGDLAVQVCADDPQVAFHAAHDLIRQATPMAVPRWLLAGFGRTSNSRSQTTPRNLLGFKDGTANIKVEDQGAMNQFVWARPPESPSWMHGGSYLVARRIKLLLGPWDDSGLNLQEQTIGRDKLSGAPLGSKHEHDPIKFDARSHGALVIPEGAHIRVTSPNLNDGAQLLRRGYSYVDGVDGRAPASGLLFLCYQRDPRKQFIPIQRRVSTDDSLNAFVQPIASAIYACPPGARPGGFVGEALLTAS
jgi:deferrochelatase/peroxidase EfeB